MLKLHRGAERVRRGRNSSKPDELWIGTAHSASVAGDLTIYVRVGEPGPLVAEVVCALLGRAVGLPIPEPFVVAIHKGSLPRSRFTKSGNTIYAFGCLALGGQDFAQLLHRDSTTSLELLLQWEHLLPAAAFDEWTANVDRNLGNIVFAAQSLWLIDHAEALGGAARRLYPLAELTETAFANKLAHVLEGAFSPADHHQHLAAAHGWLSTAAELDLAAVLALDELGHWHTPAQRAELLDFIVNRLTVTHSLLCNRLGHPQLCWSKPPKTSHSSAAEEPSSSSVPG